MDRHDRQPLSVGRAKARLREAARAGTSAGVLGGDVLAAVRRRPLAATGIALAAGVAFGASKQVRSQMLTTLVRMLR